MFLAALAAPALIYVLAVAVGPMLQGFLYSFDNYNLIRPGRAISSGSTIISPCGETRPRAAR